MRRAILACFVTALAVAAPARAELVFFASGRSLSVKSHRLDAGSLVLELRGGGEVVCDPSVITKIAPDEVPYPEDAPAAPPLPSASAAAVPYGDIIDTVAAEQGVDARLVRAVIREESAYQPTARSPRGAMGLMQLMPRTARHYDVADPYDPRANIEAGVKHLKTLLERYPLKTALAAYNAGEAAVQRFGGVPPYAETRDYVSAILSRVGGAAR